MTQLTQQQIAEIKAKAMAATAGPWFDIDFSLTEVIGADNKPAAQDIFVSCCYPDPIPVATMNGGFEGWESVEQGKKDAAFIAAANPAVILALIATLEAREVELADLYGLLWLSVSTDNLVKVARKRLLDLLSKDERKRGIEHALHSFGPVTDADMIAADIRMGIFPERSF